jgi:addiction module RelE/StbE family toxin
MARIIWTREALRQLELIHAYIDQFNPDAAQRMARRLIDAANSLRDFPQRGRPVGDDRRELPTISPYIIRYRFDGEHVIIGSIRHGAQHPD